MSKVSTKVPINFDKICAAFEFGSEAHSHYLDLITGEIIFISYYSTDQEEIDEFNEKLEQDEKRYINISYVSSDEGYEDMREFADTVKDQELREKLDLALDGRGCFRRFKDVLINYPAVNESWFKLKNDRLTERAKEWLEAKGIEVNVRKH